MIEFAATLREAGEKIDNPRAVAFADTYDLDLDAAFSPEASAAIDQLLEDEVCYEEWGEAARDFDNAGIVIIGGFVLFQLDFGEAYAHIATHQPSLLKLLFPAALLAIIGYSLNDTIIVYGRIRLALTSFVTWARATIEEQRKAARKRAAMHERWSAVSGQ